MGSPTLDSFRVEADGCWTWTGRLSNGYGRHGRGLAHRAIYEEAVGPVPDGLELDHLCRNRACVNPAHLEPVTHEENMRRARRATCRPAGHPLTNGRCRTCHRRRQEARRRRLGVPPKQYVDVARALALRASGLGVNAIARALDCDSGHLSRVLRREVIR